MWRITVRIDQIRQPGKYIKGHDIRNRSHGLSKASARITSVSMVFFSICAPSTSASVIRLSIRRGFPWERLFLFMIKAEDLLLYGAKHSRFSAPALHAQDRAELAVELHDAHGGEADVFHVVQAGIEAFSKTAQAEGLPHARPGSKDTDPPCILVYQKD